LSWIQCHDQQMLGELGQAWLKPVNMVNKKKLS